MIDFFFIIFISFFQFAFFQEANINSLHWNLQNNQEKYSLCLCRKDQNKPIYAVIGYCNTVCFCFTLCKMHYAN